MIKTTLSMVTLPTANEQASATPITGVTTSGNSREYPELAQFDDAQFHFNVASLTGSGTLDVTIEGYDPFADKWATVITFTQVSAATASNATIAAQNLTLRHTNYRTKWVVAGGTWSFTVGAVARAAESHKPRI